MPAEEVKRLSSPPRSALSVILSASLRACPPCFLRSCPPLSALFLAQLSADPCPRCSLRSCPRTPVSPVPCAAVRGPLSALFLAQLSADPCPPCSLRSCPRTSACTRAIRAAFASKAPWPCSWAWPDPTRLCVRPDRPPAAAAWTRLGLQRTGWHGSRRTLRCSKGRLGVLSAQSPSTLNPKP